MSSVLSWSFKVYSVNGRLGNRQSSLMEKSQDLGVFFNLRWVFEDIHYRAGSIIAQSKQKCYYLARHSIPKPQSPNFHEFYGNNKQFLFVARFGQKHSDWLKNWWKFRIRSLNNKLVAGSGWAWKLHEHESQGFSTLKNSFITGKHKSMTASWFCCQYSVSLLWIRSIIKFVKIAVCQFSYQLKTVVPKRKFHTRTWWNCKPHRLFQVESSWMEPKLLDTCCMVEVP